MNKYNTSSARRADLQSFLNHLEMKDISYSMDGDIIEFDETELDKAGQNIVAKLFDAVNEARYSLEQYKALVKKSLKNPKVIDDQHFYDEMLSAFQKGTHPAKFVAANESVNEAKFNYKETGLSGQNLKDVKDGIIGIKNALKRGNKSAVISNYEIAQQRLQQYGGPKASEFLKKIKQLAGLDESVNESNLRKGDKITIEFDDDDGDYSAGEYTIIGGKKGGKELEGMGIKIFMTDKELNSIEYTVNEAIDPLPSYEVIAGLATVLGALDVAYGIKGGDSIVIDATKALKSYIGDKINAVGPAAKRVIAKFKKDPKVKKIIMDASDAKLNKRAVDKWVDILDHINGMNISQDSKDLITNYLGKAPIHPDAKIKDLISHAKEMLEIKESNYILEDKVGLKYYMNEDVSNKTKSDIKLFEEFFVNEAKQATRGVIYKAAKKADYPVAVVVIERGPGNKPKVIHQQLVSIPEAVPAAVKTLQNKYPNARISVESKTGLIVFTESVINEFGPLTGSGNTSANALDDMKRKAMKKSERSQHVYVIGGKYGTYKLSKYEDEGNTFAGYYNGVPMDLEESVNESGVDAKKLIKHLNKKLDWNGGSAELETRKDQIKYWFPKGPKQDDSIFIAYSGMKGSSIAKDIRAAVKDFGAKALQVTKENGDNEHYYNIEVAKEMLNESVNEAKWLSPLGDTDDFGDPYKSLMIDGKTKRGPWANMTPKSWNAHGIGRFGVGAGQLYRLTGDDWIKVENPTPKDLNESSDIKLFDEANSKQESEFTTYTFADFKKKWGSYPKSLIDSDVTFKFLKYSGRTNSVYATSEYEGTLLGKPSEYITKCSEVYKFKEQGALKFGFVFYDDWGKKQQATLAGNDTISLSFDFVNESAAGDIKLFEEYFDSVNESLSVVKESQVNEAQKYDIAAAIRAIRDYNRSGKSNEEFENMAFSIVKDLGFKPTGNNVDNVMDHLGASADGEDRIPEDADVVRELYPMLESIDEAVSYLYNPQPNTAYRVVGNSPTSKESVNEREYNAEERKSMADSGEALPDGSYPIADEEDLKNAIQSFGLGKNHPAAAKHIAKRAKALGLSDLIPDTEDFQKALKS